MPRFPVILSLSVRVAGLVSGLVIGLASATSASQGDPLFAEAQYGVLPEFLGQTRGGALADLDGDGVLDHAVGLASGQVAISIGLGNGAFAAPAHVDAGSHVFVIEALDADGDGDADLALVCNDGLVLLENDDGGGGGGGFTVTTLAPLTSGGGSLHVVDVDLDGHLDLVTPTSVFDLMIAFGDGAGGFAPTLHSIQTGAKLVVGDVDGDGDPDLVVAWVDLRVHRNDGTGSFAPAETTPLPYDASSLAGADVDGDGDLDLVASAYGPSFAETLLGVLWNDGAGAFTPAPLQSLGLREAVDDVAAVDIDGDGDLDLVLTLEVDTAATSGELPPYPALAVLHGNGAGLFSATVHPINVPGASFQHALHGFSLGDLDGDRALDAVVSPGGKSILVFRGDGAGGFVAPLPIEDLDLRERVAFADLDGDGYLDLLAPSFAAAVGVAIGDGDGGFGPVQAHAVSQVPARLEALDWDGDLALDVVTVGLQGAVDLLRGDGAGGLALGASTNLGVAVRDVARGDFDADGSVDLMVLHPGGGLLLTDDGSGGFATPTSVDLCLGGTCFPVPNGLAAGDLNLDGALDLVVAKTGTIFEPGFIDTFLGDGAGAFTYAGSTDLEGHDVELGDLDGDGVLDLVVQGPSFTAARGDGSGGFVPAGSYPVVLASHVVTPRVRLVDMNLDGILDALGSTGEVYLGDGAGAFAHQGTYTWPFSYNPFLGQTGPEIAAADIDADGRLDAVTLDTLRGTAYVSLGLPACAGEIASYGLPCAGSGGFAPTLQITGCATAGGTVRTRIEGALGGAPAILALGLGEAHLPLPNGCELLVLPIVATPGFVLSGTVPGTGALEIVHLFGAVPPGAVVTQQAFVFDPGAPASFTSTNGVRLVLP